MRKERIKKMIKLAMFEQYEGRRDLQICRFFRRDYTGLGLIANGILITVAYAIVLLALAIYNMDYLSANFSRLDYGSMAFVIFFVYIVIIAVYSVIVYTIRRLQYARAKRKVDHFYDGLTELQDIYRFDEITGRNERNTGRGSGRNERNTGRSSGRRKGK